MNGKKNDSGKLRWQFLPWCQVEEVARVMDFGARKYAPDNWQKVPDARNRYFDAAIRHIIAWRGGEKKDPETGYHHLAHATCCLLFLIWFDQKGEKKDGHTTTA